MSKLHLKYLIIMCISILSFLPATSSVFAADRENGTYSINYTVLHAANESVSISNDYFVKPATLIVENSKQYIQFTVKQSEWVQSLNVASGESFVEVDVISEDHENNTRLIQFSADADLSQPILMQMHIHVDSVQPVYDQKHTARFSFDESSIEWLGPLVAKTHNTDQGNAFGHWQFLILIYVIIALFVVATIFLIRKMGISKKQ